MNKEDIRKKLNYLIDRYVLDQGVCDHLRRLVARDDVPVRGILSDLNPFLFNKIDDVDCDSVKEIFYYYG